MPRRFAARNPFVGGIVKVLGFGQDDRDRISILSVGGILRCVGCYPLDCHSPPSVDVQRFFVTWCRNRSCATNVRACRLMLAFVDSAAVLGITATFVVAFIVGIALARTRFAWLAITAAYATALALTVGFAVSPLTVARKTMLVGLLAPLVGIAFDLTPRASRAIAPALAIVAGALSVWVFLAILQQRDAMPAFGTGLGIAAFVATLVGATLALRDDGLRIGAAGLGLGLATGICGVLSASIGYLIAGVTVAAAAGALLLVQVVLSRNLVAGFIGGLSIGALTALFAAGSLLLAELPWYALPLMLLVPAAVALPAPGRAPRIVRAAVLAAYALVAAAFPILAAWYAARGSLT